MTSLQSHSRQARRDRRLAEKSAQRFFLHAASAASRFDRETADIATELAESALQRAWVAEAHIEGLAILARM